MILYWQTTPDFNGDFGVVLILCDDQGTAYLIPTNENAPGEPLILVVKINYPAASNGELNPIMIKYQI